MNIEPYLNFNGRCEEAIEFYKSALGAEVTMLMRFKDAPPTEGNCQTPAGSENKVMHADLRIGNSRLLASDCQSEGEPKFQGISLSLIAKDDAEAKRLFTAISDGGKVCVPLAKTFFSSSFGIANDRFGVNWMIVVEH
jgi:PhnB protein